MSYKLRVKLTTNIYIPLRLVRALKRSKANQWENEMSPNSSLVDFFQITRHLQSPFICTIRLFVLVQFLNISKSFGRFLDIGPYSLELGILWN